MAGSLHLYDKPAGNDLGSFLILHGNFSNEKSIKET